jgi:serine/threonine protein kinase/tetratricopeptide (TPR) repeat protein
VSPDQLKKARDLVTAALEMGADSREAFLRSETQGDDELFEETLLMVSESETGDDDATLAIAASPRITQQFDEAYLAGKRQIGSYRLIRRLGQGGMGVVYAACLVAEDFQKQVALKLVKPTVASSLILRRFRMERQVLAGLDHPNIARLLDAGSTDEGAPYLVMEFVEGLPIDRYCESKSLTIADRLRLFLTVCDAVQYAHQNLVIHRDIKPSNILVTAEGTPKLLDFGIAKLIRPEDAEAVDLKLTATDSRPMSPHYASPEQARGETITTASDVYSLGVLLYELLTGSLPYEFKSRSPAGIEKTICETIPAPPSEAEFKGAPEPEEKMRRKLRGDLDMILLMAMRKEPSRRYHSVHQFAQDIRHHLDGLPVLAQPDTINYRLSKFVRRHRAGVAAASLAILTLVGSTVVSVYFAREATREKAAAERRFQDTRNLARFFLTDFDAAIRNSQTEARRALVSKGVEYLGKLSSEAAGDPELLREVINGFLTMGDVQGNPFGSNLGDRDGARHSYQEALRLAQASKAGGFRTEIARARMRLADLDAVGGDRRHALEQYRQALPDLKGVDEARTLIRMAFSKEHLGDARGALADYSRSMDILRAEVTKNADNVDARRSYAQAMQRVGDVLSGLGQADLAIQNLEESLRIYGTLGSSLETQRAQWTTSAVLADTLARTRRTREAEARYRENVQRAQSYSASDPANSAYRRDYILSLSRLSDFLSANGGSKAEIRSLTRNTIAALRPMVDRPDANAWELHTFVWISLNTPFKDLRRPAEVLAYANKWVEKVGDKDPEAMDGLARAYFATGQARKAAELEAKALALLPTDFPNSALRQELEANLKRFRASANGSQ